MSEQTSYDEVPYPSHAIAFTHPDALATLGHLLGLDVRPIEACRVLELGSAAGGNLVGMAEQLPHSRFVGIDLSAVQIERGNELRAELGLTNVELRHQSILDFDPAEGQFDYIICHGVYSWSPPAVQERILDICRRHLAPGGVASVSYNCLPGWSLPDSLRRVIIAELAKDASPEESRRHFFDYLGRLDSELERFKGARAVLMRAEIELARKGTWEYVFHEFFEEVNEPLLLRELVNRAARHELLYLGDLLWRQRGVTHWSETQADVPDSQEELIRREQFEDFVMHRRFRSTAMAHRGDRIQRRVAPERLYTLSVCCDPRGLEMDLEMGRPTRVQRKKGADRLLSRAGDEAVRLLMHRWPKAVAFDELCDHSHRSRAAESDEPIAGDGRRAFAAELLDLYMAEVLDLHMHCPPVATGIPERPRVRPLNRVEARRAGYVTSGWHVRIELGELERIVVQLMDGSRTQADLEAALTAAVAEPEAAPDKTAKPRDFKRALGRCLHKLSQTAVLAD